MKTMQCQLEQVMGVLLQRFLDFNMPKQSMQGAKPEMVQDQVESMKGEMRDVRESQLRMEEMLCEGGGEGK